jgi:RNA polymerase sigma factor (sigma-70 family)
VTAEEVPRRSDESQLVALMQAHANSLRGLIFRRLRGNHHVMEEIFQASCLALLVYWRRKGGLTENQAIGSFYTIALRKLFDWYKHQGRDVLCPSDDDVLANYIDERAENPFSGVATRLDLTRALDQLTARQRQALTYAVVDRLTYQTAADVMGITPDGFNKLLSAAKQTARQLPELAGYAPRAREPWEANT